jgi:hypothetical protein
MVQYFLDALKQKFRTEKKTAKVTPETSRKAEAIAQESARLLLMLINESRLEMFPSDKPRVNVAP